MSKPRDGGAVDAAGEEDCDTGGWCSSVRMRGLWNAEDTETDRFREDIIKLGYFG